jgi:hypothetical protein
MRPRSVCCLSSSERQAASIIDRLKSSGFGNSDISALLPDKTGKHDFGYERHTKAPEGAIAGAAAGGLLGLGIGWLFGHDWFWLPTFAPLVHAGPALSGLSAAAVLGCVAALVGAAFGCRRPEFEARRFEGKLCEGNILIAVHCQTRNAVRSAKKILREAGVRKISLMREAPAGRSLPDFPTARTAHA